MTTIDMREFRRLRKAGIGGSDAAAVCGALDEDGEPVWGKTPFTVWQDKTNPDDLGDDDDDDALANGRDLEDGVARIYERRTGREVRRVDTMRCDKEHKFLIANPDRLVVRQFGSERRFLECKTSSKYWTRSGQPLWGPDDSGAGGVPIAYLYQCQHYLSVLQADVIDLCVMLKPRDVRIYEIRPNTRFIEAMREREVRFWKDHVEKGVPPDPGLTQAKLVFPEDDGSTVQVEDPEEQELVRTMMDLERRYKEVKAKRDEFHECIKKWLGKSRFLKLDGNTVADWATIKGRKPILMVDKLAKEDPDLYAELLRNYGRPPKDSRRFTIKLPKDMESNDDQD